MSNLTLCSYVLIQTGKEAPEQYDVLKNGVKVAYLRLKGCEFRADVPNCGGKTVYYTEEQNGMDKFDDVERLQYLLEAIYAIDKELGSVKPLNMEYKYYYGSIEWSEADGLYRGKVLNIINMCTYEATTIHELVTEFQRVVDHIISMAAERLRELEVCNDQI